MVQPVWTTPAGDLGVYPTGVPIKVTISASPVFPGAFVQYKLLSGKLPDGLTIDIFGNISGKAINVSKNTVSTFTIRAVDDKNNIRDRTFSMLMSGINNKPKITVLPGEIANIIDSTYFYYKINYKNPVQSNSVSFSVSAGSFPPGLYLDPAGIIKGYPKKPILSNRSPTTKKYTFTVLLTSSLGNDSINISIVIRNKQLSSTPNTRPPAILNRKPLIEPLEVSDPFNDYYLLNGKEIPPIKTGEYFAFKIIGIDFDNNLLNYQFGGLPKGLVGNPITGWITGIPQQTLIGIQTYDITARVAKRNNLTLTSSQETFTVTILNQVKNDIVWNTGSDLGTIFNGNVSMLSVSASATEPLVYEIVEGSLPKNLILLDTGEIVGRVAEQPNAKLTKQNETSEFVFSVKAFSREYPLLANIKQFKITVYQLFAEPLENVYFKAFPNKYGKNIITSLLTNTDIIPTQYLYRPKDVYFGKASNVSFVHAYGMKASSVSSYINAIQNNHYERKIILGEIKTAVATDDNGKILYEVVYSTIIDDLENELGKSLPDKMPTMIPINLRLGPWVINNNSLLINTSTVKINASPGSVKFLYPAGLKNMRSSLTSSITQNFDNRLLPLWMTSQQVNTQLISTLGYVAAWVICYTKPGYAEIIKNNIDNNWNHKLNEIDFTIDSILVDKSATYNWNTNLSIPTWTDLPSGTPVPEPLDANDIVVPFSKKTIMSSH